MTRRELLRFSEFVRSLYVFRDKQSFVPHLVSSLSTLLSAEVCSYNEIDPVAQEAWYAYSPSVYEVIKDGMAILGRYASAHPLLEHVQSPMGTEARRMSDLVSMSQFQRLDIYHEFYKPMRIPYTLMTSLPNGIAAVVTLAVHRARKDFSDQDRVVLDLVQPHILQAFENTQTVSRMNQELAARDCALDQLKRGIVCVTVKGKIEWATQTGWQFLQRYFPASPRRPSELPEGVLEWMRHNKTLSRDPMSGHMPHHTLMIQQEERCLRIRLISEGTSGLLFLDECCERFPRKALLDVGLTLREAEVLSWLSQGKTNGEIGEIVGVSPRTVQKHVERIFVKLGVENRSAATAMVHELMRSLSGR